VAERARSAAHIQDTDALAPRARNRRGAMIRALPSGGSPFATS
jgi:hypothetical protein